MVTKIKIEDLRKVVQEAYAKVKDMNTGKNANYIPYLADIDSSLFGIAITLPSGQIIEVGDTEYAFGIESI